VEKAYYTLIQYTIT